MFGKKIDDEITMLQRIVALLRDLVLATVALLTGIIIYYGGNPAKLNALDWMKLVGAAFLIVTGPALCYFSLKTLLSFVHGFESILFFLVPDAPAPGGPFAWLFMKGLGLSETEYLEAINRFRPKTISFSENTRGFSRPSSQLSRQPVISTRFKIALLRTFGLR